MSYVPEADWAANLFSAHNYAWVQGFGDKNHASFAAAGAWGGHILNDYNPVGDNLTDTLGLYAPDNNFFQTSPATISKDTTLRASGNASVHVVGPATVLANPFNTWLIQTGAIPVRNNRGYKLEITLWQKVRQVNLVVALFTVNAAGTIIGTTGTSPLAVDVGNVNTNWQKFLTVFSNVSGPYIRVAIGTLGDSNTEFWLDEITFRPNEIEIPLGAIVAWHRDFALTTLSADLPEGWKLCDGSVISDPLSPLNGLTLPNLNTPDANGNGSFLRGNTTSGTANNPSLATHQHSSGTLGFTGNALAAHQHEISTSGTTGGTFAAVAANNRIDDGLGGFTKAVSAGTPSGSISGLVGTPTNLPSTVVTGNKQEPKSMDVLWIMRIR